MLLGYSDSELVNRSGYAMVHHDDLAYVASAHQERKYLSSGVQRLPIPIRLLVVILVAIGIYLSQAGGNSDLSIDR